MKTHALVLCEDIWHPGAIARRGLKMLRDCGFDFDFLKNSADWSEMNMNKFSVVVLAKSNVASATDKRPWITSKSEWDFCGHIRRGMGLVVIHSGTAGYAELPVMRGVMGGAN